MKKKCAEKALDFIKDGMVVGLGGGRTIAFLAKFIKEKELNIQVVTPSFETEELCVELGLHVLPLRQVAHVDIAFDGCDEVDRNLYALKSGGAIHTKEKLIGNIADAYMLLIDESKFSEKLSFKHPVVIEMLEDSMAYVKKCVQELGGTYEVKSSPDKMGPMMSDYGNVLANAWFHDVDDAKMLNHKLKAIAGVIDTSLVTREITSVLIARVDGFELLEK